MPHKFLTVPKTFHGKDMYDSYSVSIDMVTSKQQPVSGLEMSHLLPGDPIYMGKIWMGVKILSGKIQKMEKVWGRV